MKLNLIEEFLLLALDNKKGKFLTDSLAINHGLAGASLMKLTIAGRVEVKDKRVYVVDNTPTGIDYLDKILEYIDSSGKHRKVRYWVHRIASKWKRFRSELIDGLIDRGILTKKRRKFLGLFPYSVYPTVDPDPENELRDRLLKIINGEKSMDPRSLMLLSLMEAVKLTRVLFHSRAKSREGRKKAKELTKEFETTPLIHSTIKEVCSVVISASTSAAIRGVNGSSD